VSINLIEEYKKKLAPIGQKLSDTLHTAPIPYIASKIGPQIQNTVNDFSQFVGDSIRPTVSPVPQDRNLAQQITDPFRNIIGQTAQDTIQRLPGEAAAAVRTSPPVQLGIYLAPLTQIDYSKPITDQITKWQSQNQNSQANDLYSGLRFAGEANPLANAFGGLTNIGFGAVDNALNNRPLFQDYAKNFSKGYEQNAQYNALGQVNPLFAKELSNSPLTGIGRSFGGEVLKRGAMSSVKNGLESGFTGLLQPGTQDRIKNATDQAAFGLVVGALSQTSGDVGGAIVNNIAQHLGQSSSYVQGWIKHLNTPIATTDVDPKTGKRIVLPLWKQYLGGNEGGFINFGAEVSNPMAGKKKNPMLPAASNTDIPVPETAGTALALPDVGNASTTSEAAKQGQELLRVGQELQTSQGGSGMPPEKPLSLPGSIPQNNSNTFLDGIKSKVNKFYTEAIDRFNPLSQVAHKAGEDQAMRNAMTGYYGTGSIGQYHVDFELAPILKEHDIGDLRSAAIAMRDLELAKRGIRGSNIVEDIQSLAGDKKLDSQSVNALSVLRKLQEKLGPEKTKALGQTLTKLYQYQDTMTKTYLVDTGIMSKESYNAMKKKNQFYVPFKRVMDQVDTFLGMTPAKGAGSISSQDVVKGIKGSDKAIQDPIESIVEATYKMVGLAKRQEVAKTLVSLAPKLPEGTIKKINGPVGNQSNIALFENGKVEHYAVPQEVADAAKGLSEEALNTIVKILAFPTKIFRASATGLNPEFMAPNVARDLQSAFVNTGLNPLKWVSGLAHMIKQDSVYQDFLKSGGMTSRVALDRPFLRNTVEDITGNKGLSLPKPSSIVHVLQALGEYSEQPTRISMFEDALKKGIKQGLNPQEAAIRAANAAQEGTVNFARRGSKTQSINAIYAFLNARVQGIDRLLRTVKNDPAGASLRIGMITAAPAMALYAHNRGFQSYNDPRVVSQSDKDSNFIIMLSDTPIPQLGGAQYVKIPKGEIGKLANPIENFMSFAEGKGGDVQKSLIASLKAFSPIDNSGDLIPTTLRPLAENAANYSFFSGQQIVPDYKKNYPAGYQSTSYTSPIYKMIGDKIGVSPAKIQNMIEGYATGWAKIGSTVVNPLVPDQYKSDQNNQGEIINKAPILRRFIGGQKRTPEEQQAIDEKKQEAVKFQVNDIKGGVNRGDIPQEIGIKQIQKLENNPNAQYYIGSDGKLKTADLTPVPVPKLTGQPDVDSVLLKDYSTQLNSQISDIINLNTSGKITDDQARKMTRDLELQRFKAQVRSGSQTSQVRSYEQLKKNKETGSLTSESNQALKDFQANKITADQLGSKLKTIKYKKFRLGGGKSKKIKISKSKKIKKVKVKKLKL